SGCSEHLTPTSLSKYFDHQCEFLHEKINYTSLRPLDERRPFLASECDDLHKAEKWRRQVRGGEVKNIRDLNDEINKLLREKGHWEVRIHELGGPDYAVSPTMFHQVECRLLVLFVYQFCFLGSSPFQSDEEQQERLPEGEPGQEFIAHVPVPSQKEVEEALIRRKKMELLQKYASEALMAQSEEAKVLMGL
uniref:ISY1 splicing factor homolog n=1 Tax=Eptatretus burgeri TaxID=7764 RepID=A0A8C4NB66_EPTBU